MRGRVITAAMVALSCAACVAMSPPPPLTAAQQAGLDAVQGMVEATRKVYDLEAVRVLVGEHHKGVGATYQRGLLTVTPELLTSPQRDTRVALVLGYALLPRTAEIDATLVRPATPADWEARQMERSFEANARAVDILVRVRGMSEAEAIRSIHTVLLMWHQRMATGLTTPVYGHKPPCEEINDLLGRFPQQRSWTSSLECVMRGGRWVEPEQTATLVSSPPAPSTTPVLSSPEPAKGVVGASASPGWLGVTVEPLTPDLIKVFGADRPGVLIANVREGSPSHAAGLRPGDIILEFGNRTVGSPLVLQQAVAATRPGSRTVVKVWRGGADVTLEVTVGELSASTPAPRSLAPPEPPKRQEEPAPRVAQTPVASQEVLTNEAIISMVRGGLAEEVILLKIRTTLGSFDTRAEALVALKQAGVSDRILAAMLSKATAGPPSATPTPERPSETARPALKDKDVIYHIVGDRYEELSQTAGRKQVTSYVVFLKTEILATGSQARFRVRSPSPVFLSAYPPDAAPLIRWSQGKDRQRFIEIQAGVFDYRTRVKDENRVEVSWEKDKTGLYRITPKSQLKPGEYGFVVWPTHALQETMPVFDFGVE